ncbi:dynamin family protein [Riemerella anatipestifer]|uniref:dynamin family protein n=1 Tax=Riemerella anatipestifer TaxID=34085 RepID=UPI0030C13D02
MESQQVVIICMVVIALLIGAIIYLLVFKKQSNIIHKKDDVDNPNTKSIDREKEISQFKEKIKKLEEQLKDSLQLNESLKSKDLNSFNQDLEERLEKINKELKSTREELEDAEDEMEDCKKKWRREKESSDELKESLNEKEKKLSEISEELKTVTFKLKEANADLFSKNESITFINDILNAQIDDEKDIKDVHRKIDAIHDFVEGNLMDALKKHNLIDKEKEQFYKENIWQWSNSQKKNWIEGKKVIAFVGEFSAGKTSIVNRILSQDNDNVPKLPVSSKATTAIATYISYGMDFRSQFTDPSGRLKKIETKTFEMVKKDILSEINVSSLIQYFVMKYNNENLKEISILDTPGFSSNDPEDAKRTSEIIHEADILFWVFDANAGEINQTSLNTIQENLQGMPLFIIMNKADTKSPRELDALEKHIKTTMEKVGIAVNGYIRFSHKESIDKLMSAIQSIPKKDNSNIRLKSIFDELKAWTEQAEENLIQKSNKFRELGRVIEPKTVEMENLYEEVSNYCDEIIKIPQSKKEFFGLGDEFFKMNPNEYKSFKNNVRKINYIKESIKEVSAKVIETTQQITSSEMDLQSSRKIYNELRGTKDSFEKLLKKWDSKFKDL